MINNLSFHLVRFVPLLVLHPEDAPRDLPRTEASMGKKNRTPFSSFSFFRSGSVFGIARISISGVIKADQRCPRCAAVDCVFPNTAEHFFLRVSSISRSLVGLGPGGRGVLPRARRRSRTAVGNGGRGVQVHRPDILRTAGRG